MANAMSPMPADCAALGKETKEDVASAMFKQARVAKRNPKTAPLAPLLRQLARDTMAA